MAKFTKYNNPNRRRTHRRAHSSAYINETQDKMCALLAKCETEAEKDAILKAYSITVNP